MQVIYDQSQDITLVLSKEEERDLTEKLRGEFYEIPIRGILHSLNAYVYLAHSMDNAGVLNNSEDLDGGIGKMVMPDPGTPDPWLINLSEKGIRHLRNGWNHGIRYNGSKLFIKIKQ